MGKETKNLVFEVTVGIVLYNLLAGLLALVFCPGGPVFWGLFLGMLIAIAMFVHMAVVMEQSLKLGDERAAQKKSMLHIAIRYLAFVVIFVVILWKFQSKVNVLALVIGALGLKVGAYFQPAIRKALERIRG